MSQNTPKRGLSWPWNNDSKHFRLYRDYCAPGGKLTWLYNWEMWMPADLPRELDYVPCVRTAAQAEQIDSFLTTLQRDRGAVTAFLGFNEPEIPSQANLSVSLAVELWKRQVVPAKAKFNFRLGSPGISSDAKGKEWLLEFFKHFKHGEDEVDFVVAHWYGADFTHLQAHLEDLYGTFKKPVWLNEFAYSHMGDPIKPPTTEMVESLMIKALPWLDSCPFVERYAYFGAPADVGEWVGRASNFTEDAVDAEVSVEGKRLTKVGRMYCEM